MKALMTRNMNRNISFISVGAAPLIWFY